MIAKLVCKHIHKSYTLKLSSNLNIPHIHKPYTLLSASNLNIPHIHKPYTLKLNISHIHKPYTLLPASNLNISHIHKPYTLLPASKHRIHLLGHLSFQKSETSLPVAMSVYECVSVACVYV